MKKLLQMTNKERYNAAHKIWFANNYPTAFKDGFYAEPKMPIVTKANGLTTFICNYLNWLGHRATRINVSGRLVDGVQKQPSGVTLTTKKWIPSTTRRGTADIGSTIKINGIGRSVMWEVKIGNDKASEFQIAEQMKERKAGGVYEFVSSVDEFFLIYDSLL